MCLLYRLAISLSKVPVVAFLFWAFSPQILQSRKQVEQGSFHDAEEPFPDFSYEDHPEAQTNSADSGCSNAFYYFSYRLYCHIFCHLSLKGQQAESLPPGFIVT